MDNAAKGLNTDQEASCIVDEKIQDGNSDKKGEDEVMDPNRVHVKNLPKFIGFKAFRQLLTKLLGDDAVKKIRQMKESAFISLSTPEKAQEAMEKLNGFTLKKNVLECKPAATEQRKGRDQPAQEVRIKTAQESVTPLAHIPYEEQLASKTRECLKLARRLINDLHSAHVAGMKGMTNYSLLNPILPFTSTAVYRNKCEFTIGKDMEGKTTIGFVLGRFSKNEHYVLPVEDVPNLSPLTKAVVKEFTQFVEESGLPSFNEFTREGVWKMLTVREMSGDVMLIATVFPFVDTVKEKELKEALIQRFYTTDIKAPFRVTSLYFQSQAHASDEYKRELLAGAPYIYETVLNTRFRVSPDAFFQTNSAAAALLYETIGKLCLSDKKEEETKKAEEALKEEGGTAKGTEESEEECPEKKRRVEEEKEVEKKEGTGEGKKEERKEEERTILLDICCGTGTIGQCIMKNVDKERAKKMCCIGIELVESAVEDAKANARENGIPETLCRYVAGKAEDTFKGLHRFVPSDFSLSSSRVIGILDPPRSGIHPKVVVGCRELPSLRRLIFVSCDPSAAIKNLTDLCRPSSNKYSGEPFRIDKITPVDMFPMTSHFEWVVSLVR